MTNFIFYCSSFVQDGQRGSLLVFNDWLHSDDERLIKLLKNLGHRSLRRLSQIYCKNINQEMKGLKKKNIAEY